MRTALCLALLLTACKTQQPPLPQAPSGGGPAVVDIAVTAKGFEPAEVRAGPNQPLVLRFTRKVAETCADAVNVKGDPVRHMLPLDRAVDVKLTAPPSGKINFACPMDMIRGAVVVSDG